MKKSISNKLYNTIKRVVCLTLCLTLPITCIARIKTADAAEKAKKIGYEWTRIDKQSELNSYTNSKESYRILITYDDKYYLSGMQTMNYNNSGEYTATLINGNIKVKNKTFTTRKPYGTLYATYSGDDKDNKCQKYVINFSNDDYSNTKSEYKWLYHENMWLPCIFTYFFVNEKNLMDGFDRDGSHFGCIKSWRVESISFEFSDHHDDYFDKVVDGVVQKGVELTEEEYNTIQYMYEHRRTLADSDAEVIGFSIASFGLLTSFLTEERTFDDLCKVCKKNLDGKAGYDSSLYSFDRDAAIKRIKEEHIGMSDEDAGKLADEEKSYLEKNWKKYKSMYADWLNRDKMDTPEGTVKLLYNLSGRCDAAWRHDGNRVYASCLETGSAAGFKIFMGKEVELPTLVKDLVIEDGITYILEDYDISRGVKLLVPRSSTLIIRGAVNNFGALEVYGKVIVEEGSILTGDAEDKGKVLTNGIAAGTVNIYTSGLFYVQKGAGHAESNYADITIDGTYICDGTLLSNGNIEVREGAQFEIGPNGIVALNAYPNDTKALGTEVLSFIKTNGLAGYVLVPQGNKHELFILENKSKLTIYGQLNLFHSANATIRPKVGKDVYIDTVIGVANKVSNFIPNVNFYESGTR